MPIKRTMYIATGIDIVDVEDFKKRIERTPLLVKRLFTGYEIKSCKNDAEHLASRLAAKEAFSKAAGIRKIPWHGIEIKKEGSGKPYVSLSKELKKKLKTKSIELSLSNIRKIAIAIVIVHS